MSQEILDQRAAAVIEANKYMVLGTVTGDGLPWVTPVYFTPDHFLTTFTFTTYSALKD